MAFTVGFAGINTDAIIVQLSIWGDTSEYKIRWGDGERDAVIGAFPVHRYNDEGTYDIWVRSLPKDDSPEVHVKAFLYPNTATDQVIRGTNLTDLIVTGPGNDSIRTGPGNDWAEAGAGSDRISGGDGNNYLLAGMASDDTIHGRAGEDVILGGDGDDILNGGEDADRLYGQAGRDMLFGGDGNDILIPGAGVDKLTGGMGADRIYFSPTGMLIDPDRDTMLDFVQGQDKLNIADWSSTFKLIGEGGFSATGQAEVRFELNNWKTVVFADSDGDGIANFSFRLLEPVQLTADDFAFVP